MTTQKEPVQLTLWSEEVLTRLKKLSRPVRPKKPAQKEQQSKQD